MKERITETQRSQCAFAVPRLVPLRGSKLRAASPVLRSNWRDTEE
ncbi:MAG: hypothetical protein V7K19_23685 [Nostoc sp.]